MHFLAPRHKLSKIYGIILGNLDKHPVHLVNFWDYDLERNWLYQFMKHRGILRNGTRASLYSVFGSRNMIRYDIRKVKIFITGENVHNSYTEYSDNFLTYPGISLSLGYDYIEDSRYVRFPLWCRTSFSPVYSEKDIIKQVQRLRYPDIKHKSKFACLVASHDNSTQVRKRMVEDMSSIDMVSCPGPLFHNDDSLVRQYGNDKKKYLSRFRFNICPENSDTEGYVTEKIFDAIEAGCIPVYWGANGHPEPSILNKDAIIVWPDDISNGHLSDMCASEKRMLEFAHQPRLLEGAEEEIVSKYDELEAKLKQLFL